MEKRPNGFASMSGAKRRRIASRGFVELQLGLNSRYDEYKSLAEAAIQTNDYDKARTYYSQLLAEATAIGDAAMGIEANLRLGGIYHKLGDDRSGVACIIEANFIKDQTNSDFDIEQFLAKEIASKTMSANFERGGDDLRGIRES